MAGSGDPDGGCLSALSCFKKRGKKRLEVSRSPNRTPVAVPPAPNVAGSPASKTVADQVSASTPSHAETTVSAPAGFRVASSASIEDKPTGPASVSDQKPATPDVSVTRLDLWQEAYAEVDKKTREWIDDIPSVTNAKRPVDELVELVRCSEQKHKEDALKLKVGDREILWRDYANRVVSVLTAIGDVAIPFAPAPASTVWSAVKVLLAANVSQCKDLVAIMGCTDMVLCLVRRGRVYEEVYLNDPPMPTEQEDLRQHLVKVYTTCLDFLAFVNEEMQQGNLGRFLDALLDPGHGEQRLSEVKALEQQLDFAARACEAKAGNEHRKLLQSLEGPLKRVDNNVTAVLEKLQSDERRRAMEYISIVPVGSYHNEKRERRTKDTCDWLVAHPKFLEWENLACSSVFWLQGRIGTGKSFLSSKVIDRYWISDPGASQLLSENDEGVAFFYCSSTDPTRRNTTSILRSYIRQLSELPHRSESIHRVSYKLYDRKGRIQSDISMEDCEATLVEIINSYPRTTLVLDALDECEKDTREELVRLFKRFVQKSERLLKIFIASRPESDISDYLKSFRSPQTLVSISTSDNRGDIDKFVTAEMAAFATPWKHIPPETKQLVKETLVENSDGMFRWTYLQWEQLKKYSVNLDIKRRLGRLPNTLSAAYDEIYDQYDSEGFERVMLQRAVRWVMCARRPLNSCTLLSAIRVESAQSDGEKALDQSDLTEQTLETVCRHLVVRDSDLGVWKFPHASVAEYFGEKDEPWIKNAQTDITTVLINGMIDCCAACPSVWEYHEPPQGEVRFIDEARLYDEARWWEYYDPFGNFSPCLQQGEVPNNTLDPRHPFQIYTQLHWYHHVQNIPNQDAKAVDVLRALKRFLGENGCQESSREYQVFWKYVHAGGQRYYYSRCRTPYPFTSTYTNGNTWYEDASPVSTSAFAVVIFGLHRLLSGWWDNNPDVSSLIDRHHGKLLELAAERNDADLCKYLIDRAGGIIINNELVDLYQRLLVQFFCQGRLDVARVLLAHGANPNCYADGSSSLLCWATERGSAYIKFLLDNGADPNFPCFFVDPEYYDWDNNSSFNCKFTMAPYSAADKGDITALKLLIEGGAIVQSLFLEECLCLAIGKGHVDCTRFLLEQGTNADPSYFTRPLIVAIRNGRLDCANMLIERGADVNMELHYSSPLTVAVSEGRLDGARFLIERGADVNTEGDGYVHGSPLAAAVSGRNFDCARILIENGADVNLKQKGRRGASPLIAAVRDGHTDFARFLIELGADVNMEADGFTSGSPLAVASSRGHLGCIRVLIDNGADVHATLEFGDYSCVLAAAIFGVEPSLKTIKYLVEEKNADPAQLALGRPDIIQEGGTDKWGFWGRWNRGSLSKEDKREGSKILVYLVEELKLGTSTLASLGFSIDDKPPYASSIAPSIGNGSGGFSDASSD